MLPFLQEASSQGHIIPSQSRHTKIFRIVTYGIIIVTVAQLNYQVRLNSGCNHVVEGFIRILDGLSGVSADNLNMGYKGKQFYESILKYSIK